MPLLRLPALIGSVVAAVATYRRGVAQGLWTPKSFALVMAVCLLYAVVGTGVVPLGILLGAEHVTLLMVLFLASAAIGALAVVKVAARILRAYGPQTLRRSDPSAPDPQDGVRRSRLNSGSAG